MQWKIYVSCGLLSVCCHAGAADLDPRGTEYTGPDLSAAGLISRNVEFVVGYAEFGTYAIHTADRFGAVKRDDGYVDFLVFSTSSHLVRGVAPIKTRFTIAQVVPIPKPQPNTLFVLAKDSECTDEQGRGVYAIVRNIKGAGMKKKGKLVPLRAWRFRGESDDAMIVPVARARCRDYTDEGG